MPSSFPVALAESHADTDPSAVAFLLIRKLCSVSFGASWVVRLSRGVSRLHFLSILKFSMYQEFRFEIG